MGSKEESASRWLNKKVAEAKGTYIAASVFIALSAGCFVVFCWYLSGFAALWVDQGLVVSGTLFVTRVSDDLKPYFAFFIPYVPLAFNIFRTLMILNP